MLLLEGAKLAFQLVPAARFANTVTESIVVS